MSKLDDALDLKVQAQGEHGPMPYDVPASREDVRQALKDLFIELVKGATEEQAKGNFMPMMSSYKTVESLKAKLDEKIKAL